MLKPLKFPPIEELHQLILQSVEKSDVFENEKVRDFTVVVLDLFIHKCNGLKFFVDYYEVDGVDMELYFKKPIMDRYDEEFYKDLVEIIEENSDVQK